MKRTLSPLAVFVLMQPGNASAHAMLTHADPGADAVLHKAPAQVQLQFSETLEPAFSGITVSDSGGNSVANGAAEFSGGTITTKLKSLSAGQYRVKWRAVSVDTHRTDGAYSFTIAP